MLVYGRDNDGRVTSVTDDAVQAGQMYAMSYDALGRVYDETAKYIPGGDRILQHRYDRYGNRNSLTTTGDGVVANAYVFNKLNQMGSATLAGAPVTANYYANDDMQSLSMPNSVTRSYTYKANGPVDTIGVANSSGSIAQFAYAYDDALNVDTVTDNDGLHDYGYDGLNRLTTATHPAPSGLPTSEGYTYTAVGNRKDTANPTAWTFDNNHRITASPGLTYTFDADGNLATRSDSVTTTHDARNRLTQFVKGAVTSNYLYDYSGRRVKKTVGGTATWYWWDSVRLISEHDAAGARQKRYGYWPAGFAPAQVQDTAGTYFVHADHLDTPRALTNSSGQIVWRSKISAYGTAVVQEDVDGNSVPVVFNFRFPGQYSDAESGMHYNFMRHYDASIGRYVQSDPIGLLGGINTYLYAGADPISRIDPEGLKPPARVNIPQTNQQTQRSYNSPYNTRIPPPRTPPRRTAAPLPPSVLRQLDLFNSAERLVQAYQYQYETSKSFKQMIDANKRLKDALEQRRQAELALGFCPQPN
jgi:RHS repeat-associated protein